MSYLHVRRERAHRRRGRRQGTVSESRSSHHAGPVSCRSSTPRSTHVAHRGADAANMLVVAQVGSTTSNFSASTVAVDDVRFDACERRGVLEQVRLRGSSNRPRFSSTRGSRTSCRDVVRVEAEDPFDRGALVEHHGTVADAHDHDQVAERFLTTRPSASRSVALDLVAECRRSSSARDTLALRP